MRDARRRTAPGCSASIGAPFRERSNGVWGNTKRSRQIKKQGRLGRSQNRQSGKSRTKKFRNKNSLSSAARLVARADSKKDLAVLLPQRGRVRHTYGKKEKYQGWTKSAENRSWVGHWEGDTIVGRDRARLLTHVDRKSRFLVATILSDGHAETVHRATVKAFKKVPCRSITYDRGSEFALWRLIERDTKATVYFARAHAPWKRGTNENTNGLLRRSFPKGT